MNRYINYLDELRNPDDDELLRIEEKYQFMQYKKRRERLVFAAVITLSSFIIYLIGHAYMAKENIVIEIISITTGLSGIGMALLTYLQGNEISINSNNGSAHHRLQVELEELKFDFQKLKKKGGINDDAREINESINNIINNIFTEQFIRNKIEKSFSDNAIKSENYNSLFREFEKTSQRINEELLRLRKSANINLVIGSLFTTMAIISLTYEVFFQKLTFGNLMDVLSHYIPRISLIIFIEVFAFFFLKLYKSNLHEIKYFNNEKTNIDFKLITLKTALFQEDLEMIKICLSELIKTERNFVLKKDESTVELHKIKYENEFAKNLTSLFEKFVSKKE